MRAVAPVVDPVDKSGSRTHARGLSRDADTSDAGARRQPATLYAVDNARLGGRDFRASASLYIKGTHQTSARTAEWHTVFICSDHPWRGGDSTRRRCRMCQRCNCAAFFRAVVTKTTTWVVPEVEVYSSTSSRLLRSWLSLDADQTARCMQPISVPGTSVPVRHIITIRDDWKFAL